MVKIPQPAKKSYFFEKGYMDLSNTIKGAWTRNMDSVEDYKTNIQIARGSGERIVALMKIVINVMGIISVILFGSIITCVISSLNIIVLLTIMLCVYIGFSIVWIVDRIYLFRKKIFTACHECKEKMQIPTYICPGCGEKHSVLTPGVYGILKRTCNCGEKMPTTFFNKVNGKQRRDLDAICPICEHSLSDRETVPICIPVVGGRSVGKTAFITAFSHDFIETVAPSKGWVISSYDTVKDSII